MQLEELPSWEITRERGDYVWKSVEPGEAGQPAPPAVSTSAAPVSREMLQSYCDASAALWGAAQACAAQGGSGEGAIGLWREQERAFAELSRQRELLGPCFLVENRRDTREHTPLQMEITREKGHYLWKEGPPPQPR